MNTNITQTLPSSIAETGADEAESPKRRQTSRKTAYRRRKNHQLEASIKQKLKALKLGADNHHGTLALLEDFLLISSAVGLSVLLPWMYPISLLIIGTRQRALATLLHEASHSVLCANRHLNNAIGMVSGWSIAQSFFRYRKTHVGEHHPNLGDETRDPDTVNYLRQGLFEAKPNSLIKDHLVPLALGFKTWPNLRNLLRDRLIPQHWSELPRRERVEYIGFILFWTTVFCILTWTGHLKEFALYWVVPYFTVFQAVNWVIEVAKHFPLTRLSNYELEMTRNRVGLP